MSKTTKNYLLLIAIHIIIGVLVFYVRPFSKIYGTLIYLFAFYFVVKTKNKNNEVLYASAYIVGAEVFLRMTNGNAIYEYGKYGLILFSFLGMFYSGFSKKSLPYCFFLLFLLPGIFIGTQTLNLGTDIRKTIIFNISGPVSLAIASLYAFQRKISIKEIDNILLILGLPIITCAVYVTLYTPKLKEVLTGVGSNFDTSGGFGPNQVATVFGLGMFIFFTRLLFNTNNKILFISNLAIGLIMVYRGLITFSRGGVITGFLMLMLLLLVVYMFSKRKQKNKLNIIIIFFSAVLVLVFLYSESQTGGLMSKRYANQDATGRTKASKFTGREKIAENEISAFLDNPIWGIGVAKGLQLREQQMGETVASHNEITRMLSEHGIFGVFGLLILIVTPFTLYLNNKQHIYMISFFSFWLLTINHAAMRTALPSFVYSLSLLKVYFEKK